VNSRDELHRDPKTTTQESPRAPRSVSAKIDPNPKPPSHPTQRCPTIQVGRDNPANADSIGPASRSSESVHVLNLESPGVGAYAVDPDVVTVKRRECSHAAVTTDPSPVAWSQGRYSSGSRASSHHAARLRSTARRHCPGVRFRIRDELLLAVFQ
jgi:hypothetical protein